MLALTIQILTVLSLVLMIAVYLLQLWNEYLERKNEKPPV